MSTTERNTLLLLFGLGVVGHGVRLLSLAPEDAPGSVSILSQLAPADLSLQRALVVRAGRPLAGGETIDLNAASARDIARLPRIGPALSKEIVKVRDDAGGFTSMADLEQVSGVGPALTAAIADHVTLGDTLKARRSRDQRAAVKGQAVFGRPEPQVQPPLVVQERKTKRTGSPGPLAPTAPVSLNRATEADLVALPGIGPTRAKAILAYRDTHGPFRSVADLDRVPGLPRRLVRDLAARVQVP